jgi:hypothetical protein
MQVLHVGLLVTLWSDISMVIRRRDVQLLLVIDRTSRFTTTCGLDMCLLWRSGLEFGDASPSSRFLPTMIRAGR